MAKDIEFKIFCGSRKEVVKADCLEGAVKRFFYSDVFDRWGPMIMIEYKEQENQPPITRTISTVAAMRNVGMYTKYKERIEKKWKKRK